MTGAIPPNKPKEVVIVIDDPRTGRAHLEFPETEEAMPEEGAEPQPSAKE
jgi:hypothetical protein